jgi:hypothetical protein
LILHIFRKIVWDISPKEDVMTNIESGLVGEAELTVEETHTASLVGLICLVFMGPGVMVIHSSFWFKGEPAQTVGQPVNLLGAIVPIAREHYLLSRIPLQEPLPHEKNPGGVIRIDALLVDTQNPVIIREMPVEAVQGLFYGPGLKVHVIAQL